MTAESDSVKGIGTLQEKSLHAGLKEWYACAGDRLEVPIDGFVIDIVRGELLIEIQTANFAAIKRKLLTLTERYSVRLVYPIAREKWIVRMSADGRSQIGRRKSPKRGRLEHVFDELVRFPELIASPNFALEVLFVQEEEIRRNDGRGSWRRRGWSIHNHRLLKIVDQVHLASPADFEGLIPTTLPHPVSNRDLARALNLSRHLAQRMTYCLRKMGVLTIVGKRRRALLYAPTTISPEA